VQNESTVAPSLNQTVTQLPKTLRLRSKAHLAYVSPQPYPVCQRKPSDAHHPNFAQPNVKSRNVSDELTVHSAETITSSCTLKETNSAGGPNVGISPPARARAFWNAGLSTKGQVDPFAPPSMP
jgi:hypothetical protein